MNRLPAVAAVVVALLLARLLPAEGVFLYARLALATALVLAPGALVARALGRPGGAETLVWTLLTVLVGLVATVVVGGSLALVASVVAAVGLAALPHALRREPRLMPPGAGWAIALGVVVGVALWRVSGHLGGDALFHLARTRKLIVFDDLSLDAVSEFADGSLHPGYAVPLWHAFLALVSRAGGVDPSLVVLHEPSVLAPLAVVLAYQAGWAVFRRASAAWAVAVAQVAVTAIAPGHGGAYTALALPATASRQLLVPAVIVLFFAHVREPRPARLASLAAASLVLAVVHPTYAFFVALPLGGFVVARFVLARADLRRGVAALAAVALPAIGYSLWLLPIVRQTVSHEPGESELRRALRHYADQLDVFSLERYRIAPELFGRTGALAVAALLLVPLAVFSARRRWAAFVLGGSLAVLVVALTPALFVPFADAVSLSQARRLAGFVPFAFAFAGGTLVLARLLGPFAVVAAVAGAVALQRAYPGNFEYGAVGDAPSFATWVALGGGAAALLLGALLGWWLRVERSGTWAALAATAFVLPLLAHARWSPDPRDRPVPLTAGLVQALRQDVPKRAVVFSDLETSYRIAAFAPVYVAAAPPGHVADTEKNRPFARREDVVRFLRLGDIGIPRRYGATWLVIDRRRFDTGLDLEPLYADSRYQLFRIG
jgi:hypothetical protein